jgi:hypothetical protein
MFLKRMFTVLVELVVQVLLENQFLFATLPPPPWFCASAKD